ncbi:DUF2732 family protein [Pantoea agglomerans]|uniref:DUF2732 domain-containing protein n=1 Tax=Enterobacter agglomerans TaxID=549 RepID=A0ACC5RKA5_ENTAG|nr:DUF2732 family protein [Pantoea agglomerans]MBK4725049.1 DUF2732 domain-containing protein [Pantoea agglomerans]
MRNLETKKMNASEDALLALLNKACNETRKDGALSVSIRLEAIAIHAQRSEMSAVEIIELLRQEAGRFEATARELH